MKLVFLTGLMCLLAGACSGADAGAEDEPAQEETMAEDQEALNLANEVNPNLIHLRTPEEKEQAIIEDSLTGWTAHVNGTGELPPCPQNTSGVDCRHYQVYPSDPHTIDTYGSLVLVRKERPKEPVTFSLHEHWKKGDAYFTALMKQHHLTPLDMVGILGAIEQLPKPPTPRMRTYDCYECGDNPPFPGLPGSPGSEHPGGGTAGTKPPPGGTPANFGYPRGSGSNGGLPTGHPDPNLWHRLQDLQNGIEKGDPAAKPSPFDPPGYIPAKGEHAENFKCEGHVYNGYKRNCIDFESKSIGEKWTDKISNFLQRASDAYGKLVLHDMWHDGKDPACTDTCNWYSNRECGLRTTGQSLIFAGEGLALGPYGAATLAAFAAGGVATAFNDCIDEIRKICAADICGR